MKNATSFKSDIFHFIFFVNINTEISFEKKINTLSFTKKNTLVHITFKEMSKTPVVYIVYYSMYGHMEKMARSVATGVERSGATAKLFQVAETLPEEVLIKMYAPPKPTDVPVITASELAEADGILFGVPTRFGGIPTQVRTLLDATGQLWMKAGL
jgi:flavorubredoxin